MFEPPADACAARGRIFEKGDVVKSSASYFQGIAGHGSKTCGQVVTDRTLLRRGRERVFASFVAAREVVVETGGRIDLLTLEAEDGARARFGGWDGRRGEPVQSLGSSDGAGPWVPKRAAFLSENLFGDAACTRELAAKAAYDAVCPLTAVFDPYRSVNALYEIGPRVTGGTYSRDANGNCVLAPPSVGEQLYEVGVARPAATFEPSRIVEVGAGRLHARFRAAADGTPIDQVDVDYRDTERDEDCKFFDELIPRGGGAGTYRCLPLDLAEAVPCNPSASNPCPRLHVKVARGRPPPKAATYISGERCASEAAVHTVREYIGSDDSSDDYALGEIIPLDAFVHATFRIDPRDY